MKKTFFLFLLILLFTSCSQEVEMPKLSSQTVILPQISSEHQECLIRYKNTFHDNSNLLTYKLRIINIRENKILSRFADKVNNDNAIVEKLNKDFKKAGIRFKLHDSSNEYSGESIADFVYHFNKYKKYGLLTLLVYHTDDITYNGIAAGAPENVAGVHITKSVTTTTAHEIAHLLGLLHTFERDSSNGYNGTYGDKICDTPAYDLMSLTVNSDCDVIKKPKWTKKELEIIIPNFQSYTDDCREKFSPVQILVMRWYTENTPILYASLY